MIRKILLLWAKTGVAPGYLHHIVDLWSAKLNAKNLIRKVFGNSYVQCNLSDHVQSRIYFFGAYEPIEAKLFLDLITPDMHIVDAGANIGFYSIISSAKLKTGQVFAFEPIESNYKQLEHNISLSKKTNINVIKYGLWHKEDTLSFSLSDEHEHNHGSFTAGKVNNSIQNIKCPVRTLDSFLADQSIPKVDLIKMDIEGAELFALQGGMQTIDKFLPSILIEINQEACKKFGYSSEKIDQLLLPKGYKIFRIESLAQNSHFIDTTKEIVQSNVFYVSPKDLNRFQTHWDYKQVKRFFAQY